MDQSKLAPLLELKYRDVNDAARELGGIQRIRQTFIGFQQYLYSRVLNPASGWMEGDGGITPHRAPGQIKTQTAGAVISARMSTAVWPAKPRRPTDGNQGRDVREIPACVLGKSKRHGQCLQSLRSGTETQSALSHRTP